MRVATIRLVTNPRRKLCAAIASTSFADAPASRKSRFTTSTTSRPSIRVSRRSQCGENATNSGPFFCSRMASQASSAATAHGPLSIRGTATNCPAPPWSVALADRDDQKTGPAEVEVLDVEGGDLGPSPPRGKRQQQDRPIADCERRRRWPL
jgi:hypothetical protein